MASDVLHRAIRELLLLHKRSQTRRIVVASELGADGSVAFHVKSVDAGEMARQPCAQELDAIALWDVDQRLRQVGAYLEIRSDAGVCASVVFPGQLLIPR